jgi:[ribosomal protein S5]-alanine N-acetyltransferase
MSIKNLKKDQFTSVDFIDLYSARLILLKLGMFGLKDMHEYSINEDFYRFLEFLPYKTKEDTSSYLKKLIQRSSREDAHYWFIKFSEEDKIIGTLGLHDIDWSNRVGEVSYGISPDYSRRGFFTEALMRVLDYCFNDLEFERICASTMADNLASVNGLKRCGFIKKRIINNCYYSENDGLKHDALILEISRDEYLRR